MAAKILVVDDELDTVNLLSLTLGRAGYMICRGHSGRQALEVAQAEKPDVIILDVMMPDMSGLDVLKALHQSLEHMPRVILFTARSRVEDLVAGMEAGAFRYLVKPTSRDKLLETVKAALEEG